MLPMQKHFVWTRCMNLNNHLCFHISFANSNCIFYSTLYGIFILIYSANWSNKVAISPTSRIIIFIESVYFVTGYVAHSSNIYTVAKDNANVIWMVFTLLSLFPVPYFYISCLHLKRSCLVLLYNFFAGNSIINAVACNDGRQSTRLFAADPRFRIRNKPTLWSYNLSLLPNKLGAKSCGKPTRRNTVRIALKAEK